MHDKACIIKWTGTQKALPIAIVKFRRKILHAIGILPLLIHDDRKRPIKAKYKGSEFLTGFDYLTKCLQKIQSICQAEIMQRSTIA